jgi:16S rRNA (adenine1518-N6/adenine1519-N6)-dimethyltransferase
VVEADALRVDAAALPAPRKIVANLPYNVATPLLVGWLRAAAAFEGMALMFQQEVAERICAAPDTDAYGRLSVLAQWRCRCELLLRLPRAPSPRPPRCGRPWWASRRAPRIPARRCSRRWSG